MSEALQTEYKHYVNCRGQEERPRLESLESRFNRTLRSSQLPCGSNSERCVLLHCCWLIIFITTLFYRWLEESSNLVQVCCLLSCVSVRLSRSLSNVMGDRNHPGNAHLGATQLEFPIHFTREAFYSKPT